MMKSAFCRLSALAVLAGFGAIGFAQSAQPALDAARLDRIQAYQAKVHRIALAAQLLPLVMTKSQINTMLGVVEKARGNVRKTYEKEEILWQSVEKDIEASLDGAINKGQFPSREADARVSEAVSKISQAEQLIAATNVQMVWEALDKTLNVGQKKAAANSLRPADLGLTQKPEEMSQKDKEQLFVRYVFLDPATYDILLEMYKHAAN